MSANAENLSENVIECKANVKLEGRKNKNSRNIFISGKVHFHKDNCERSTSQKVYQNPKNPRYSNSEHYELISKMIALTTLNVILLLAHCVSFHFRLDPSSTFKIVMVRLKYDKNTLRFNLVPPMDASLWCVPTLETYPETTVEENERKKQVDDDRLMYCPECNTTAQYERGSGHRACPKCSTNYKFKCRRCNKLYLELAGLQNHQRDWCGGNPNYPCDLCSYKSHSKCNLEDHKQRVHGSNYEVACAYCGKPLKNQMTLKRHLKKSCKWAPPNATCRKKKTVTFKGSVQINPIPPNIASIDPVANEALMQQMRECFPEQDSSTRNASLTVYCSTCNSIMEYVARKTKRICRICHDEMRFPCPRCRRLYKEMKHLRQHMRYGCNSEPSFQCSECACKFTRKGSLVQHVKLKHTSYRHKTNDDDVDGKNIEKDDSDTEFEKLQESFARDLKSHKRVKKAVKKQQIQKAKSCSLKIELVRCDTDPKFRKSDDDSSRSSFNGNITKSIARATFTNETSRAHGDIGLSTDPSDWESSAPVFHFCIQCRFISRPTGESWIPTIKYCAHCNICMHYLCSGCDRIIDTPEVLRRHMRSRCSEPSGLPASQIYGRRSCRGCGGYFDALEEHEANCRPNQTGKCDLCDVQIGSLDELKKHIAMCHLF
uniref:C2H2-type domain-containing protein n=1 Tax=Trichogramma kaykai TaxID=54128 RepID=A0ABD2WV31_9HYME